MPKVMPSEIKIKTDNNKDQCAHDFKKAVKDLGELAKKAKSKFDKTDDKTKKKIVAGALGAAALIAGAIGYKLNKKHKDQK